MAEGGVLAVAETLSSTLTYQVLWLLACNCCFVTCKTYFHNALAPSRHSNGGYGAMPMVSKMIPSQTLWFSVHNPQTPAPVLLVY